MEFVEHLAGTTVHDVSGALRFDQFGQYLRASDRGGGLCGKGATGGEGSQGESDAGEKFGVHDVLPYSEGSVKKVVGRAKETGGLTSLR